MTHLNNSNSNKLKQLILKSCQDSSAHGIPNVVRTHKLPINLLWIFFITISTALCAYLIIQNITNYLAFNVVTKIRDINEFPSTFPTISICNTNLFSSENNSIEYLKKIGADFNLPDIFNETIAAELESNGTLATIGSQYYFFGLLATNDLNVTAKKSLGYNINDFLISCTYINKNCNMSEFEWFWHYIYGNCFKFNSGIDSNRNRVALKTITGNSIFSGLNLVLFSSVADKLKLTFSTNQQGLGIAIFIHNSSTSPLTVNSPLTFKGNTQANIAMSREFSKKLPRPYSECDLDADNVQSEDNSKLNHLYTSDLFQLIAKQGFDYTQIDCVNQCFQKHLIKRCNCTFSVIPNYYEQPSCSLQKLNCASNFYVEFNSNDFIQVNCFPLCPLECQIQKYKTSISYSDFPTESYEQDLFNNAQVKKLYSNQAFSSRLGSNLLNLNIYYNRLGYTSIEESPSLDSVTLFSNIGGAAGLLLGISVLSLVEVLETLIEIGYAYRIWTKFKTKLFKKALTRKKIDPI